MTPLEVIAKLAEHADSPKQADDMRALADALRKADGQQLAPGFVLDLAWWPAVVVMLARMTVKAAEEMDDAKNLQARMAARLYLQSVELQLRRPPRRKR